MLQTIPSNSSPESDSEIAGTWGYLAIGAVVIFWIVLLIFFVGYRASAHDYKNLGPVGDWFGGLLNPVIAFLALIGLVKSVLIQRETLKETTDGLQLQLKLQIQQANRQTFFDLLKLRTSAVNAIEWSNTNGGVYKGRAAIRAILKALDSIAPNISVEEIKEDLERWRVPSRCPEMAKPYVALFAAFYSREPASFATAWYQQILTDESQLDCLEAELGHVFRATYQVMKFAYECLYFTAKEKQDLANYLRAQMSEDEFALFALTALTSIGEKSRAASIAFDLYEDRLFSIPWAREMRLLFVRADPENQMFARSLGYADLSDEGRPC